MYRIRTFDEYRSAYARSVDAPEDFWADVASAFAWKKKWSRVLEWEFTTPDIKWFQGAQLNITENCLRTPPRGDALALWLTFGSA